MWPTPEFATGPLDRHTRGPRQHGKILKRAGLDVLRALLQRFYSYATGECFPSYDAIAEAAGCCRSTVAAKLRTLEQLGIIETIRRKVVASFTSRAHRVRFDVAVQTSNSYAATYRLPTGRRLVMSGCRCCDLGQKLSPNFGLKPTQR